MQATSGIRWGRVILGALLSEAAVIIILAATIMVYRFVISPGRTSAEYQAFGELAGYYVAPAAAALATFFSVLWVARKLTSDFVLNGTLVGAAAVLLTVGFLFGAKPEYRLMYIVSFLLRIAGGFLGGLAARTIFKQRRLATVQPV